MNQNQGNTLLITGGTGSFGHAVLKRFLNTDHYDEIRIYSRDEKKQHDMRLAYKNPKLSFHLGDVRDVDSLHKVMVGVDHIFHAAALKQVPSCEFFPMEAVKTNVIGTQNVIDVADFHKVERLIVLSTDKAAYPINAMGISKAMMEKVAIAASRSLEHTTLCLTRYGNVMGSRGSVIPLFINQIKNNQPITITEPNMTRFLMSLDEAVDLVLFAFEHGKQGDLFIHKAPAATILNLAKALMQIYDTEVPIKVIGIRHGEKMDENLCTVEERMRADDLGKFFRIPADSRDLNYNKYFSEGEEKDIRKYEDFNSNNTKMKDVEGVKQLLYQLPFIQSDLNGKKHINLYEDL